MSKIEIRHNIIRLKTDGETTCNVTSHANSGVRQISKKS